MKSIQVTRGSLPSLLAVSAGFFYASCANADLNAVSGMTPVQAPVASTIQTICPKMAAQSSSLTAEQQLLLSSCRKLVQTSNGLQHSGPSGQSLGLTESGLRAALQGVSPEEMNAQNRSRTFAGNAPIGARLLALRRGAGGGPLASSTFDLNGQPLLLSEMLPFGSRGGGASADSGPGGPWSGFVQGHYNWGTRDRSAVEDRFDFHDVGVTAGVDYRFSDSTVAGIALSYAHTKADFDNGLGDVESNNAGVSLYGSHSFGKAYVEGFVGYTKVDFDSARRILVPSTTGVSGFDTTAKGSTNADQFTASIATGYDWSRDSMTITPFVRLSYAHLGIDGFTERESRSSLGLDVKSRSVNSLQSAIGAQITKAISVQSGVISPYAAIEWNHEFQNNNENIVAKYTHDPFNTFFTIPTAHPDRDYFTLRAGLTSVFPSGVSAFANLDTVVGLRDTTSTSLTVGVRLEF